MSTGTVSAYGSRISLKYGAAEDVSVNGIALTRTLDTNAVSFSTLG